MSLVIYKGCEWLALFSLFFVHQYKKYKKKMKTLLI